MCSAVHCVTFVNREYGFFSRALLQKRPTILRSLRIVTTSYQRLLCSLFYRALFYRALLQKRPIILRSLRIVTTLYQSVLCSLSYRALFYRALWQKWPIILRSLLIVTTPYQSVTSSTLCHVCKHNSTHFDVCVYKWNTRIHSAPFAIPTCNGYDKSKV